MVVINLQRAEFKETSKLQCLKMVFSGLDGPVRLPDNVGMISQRWSDRIQLRQARLCQCYRILLATRSSIIVHQKELRTNSVGSKDTCWSQTAIIWALTQWICLPRPSLSPHQTVLFYRHVFHCFSSRGHIRGHWALAVCQPDCALHPAPASTHLFLEDHIDKLIASSLKCFLNSWHVEEDKQVCESRSRGQCQLSV